MVRARPGQGPSDKTRLGDRQGPGSGTTWVNRGRRLSVTPVPTPPLVPAGGETSFVPNLLVPPRSPGRTILRRSVPGYPSTTIRAFRRCTSVRVQCTPHSTMDYSVTGVSHLWREVGILKTCCVLWWSRLYRSLVEGCRRLVYERSSRALETGPLRSTIWCLVQSHTKLSIYDLGQCHRARISGS